MKNFLSVVCLVALFIGCGNEANAAKCPSWKSHYKRHLDMNAPLLEITSNDDIVIKNITINRGNCSYAQMSVGSFNKKEKLNKLGPAKGYKLLEKGGFKREDDKYGDGLDLKFGESFVLFIECKPDQVLEVKLETNLGECVLPKNR